MVSEAEIREFWSFTSDQKYFHKRILGNLGVQEERGTYSVQGDRITLKLLDVQPSKPIMTQNTDLRWSVGTDPYGGTRTVLFLYDDFGARQLYYPDD